MANKKVSQLDTATALDGTETMYVVQGGASRQTDVGVSLATLKALTLGETGLDVLASATDGAALTALGVSAFSQTLLDDATADAALDTLGFGAAGKAIAAGATAADVLSDLGTPLTANTILVDNAAGTLREAKSFAEVRQKLESIPFTELGTIEAWNNGVLGGGTDQTTALQSIVDSLPAEGGQVVLKGDVRITALNLQGKRNIRFIGLGGNGTGATQRTLLRTDQGAVGGRIIDARDSFNISFEKMFLYAANAAFNARLIDFANIVTGSSLMSLDDCYVNVNGTGTAVWLYGATQGNFQKTTFGGPGRHVQMQNAVGVGFCNVHNFTSCNFKPTGTMHPVQGSGEGITFQTCNVQASSADGKMYFWSTDLTQPFNGVSLICNTFYDATATGFIGSTFYTGFGLNLIGNRAGGHADVTSGGNWCFQIGGGTDGTVSDPKGVLGWVALGNTFQFMTAGINLGGTPATFDTARCGVEGANSTKGTLTPSGRTQLFSNPANAEGLQHLGSYIHSGATDFGATFGRRDWPTSAAGLQTGDIWRDAAAGGVLKAV